MAVEIMGVSVYAGTFASQPLVFAHLHDAMPELDLDHVEVILGADPMPRLCHALSPQDARQVEDLLGARSTVVLIFDAALAGGAAPGGTALLDRIARLSGHRHRPAP